MGNSDSLKIDAYAHISPSKYTETLRKDYTKFYNALLGRITPLFDMEARFRIMDKYQPLAQVLTVKAPRGHRSRVRAAHRSAHSDRC